MFPGSVQSLKALEASRRQPAYISNAILRACAVSASVAPGPLESLSITPRPRGVEKLQGHPRFYRITVGKSHRLIYHILREKLIIVLLIRDRKDAYKAIDDLDGKLEVALLHIEDVVTTKLRKVGK
jgi:mRNA-degrading endonuclease RelE of RelBE toxin-antitoxin system